MTMMGAVADSVPSAASFKLSAILSSSFSLSSELLSCRSAANRCDEVGDSEESSIASAGQCAAIEGLQLEKVSRHVQLDRSTSQSVQVGSSFL